MLKFLQDNYKNIILILVIFSVILFIMSRNSCTPELFTIDEKIVMFDTLRNDMFPEIFPKGERNSAGFAWFKYLTEYKHPKGHPNAGKKLSQEEFDQYNQMYCGVSGAIVEPIPSDIDYKNYDYIKLKDMKGNEVWGKYYRCCDPCCADLMREDNGTPNVRVEKYNYSGKNYNVITIEDPCKNPKKIPEEVKSVKCKNGKCTSGILSKSGRLIMAVLYPVPKGVTQKTLDKNYDDLMDKYYDSRNSVPPEKVVGGMGSIFIELSK